ncbi:spore coat associated protein CotJA [Ruminococcus albus]|uniref:Spore coat associated protein JA (CotJA) n=1 Tax=Ruminococcus albus TaxID=1264 RepID=A0A1H7KB62_RUMAL|nr:spore coat associated protein CotJA [Ruminococcus albus]SEK83696.1 Spore coat associated protein JA (CotJA) [Ruminococcus albus]
MENTEKDILERIFDNDGVPDAASCAVAGGTLPKNLAFAMAYVPFQPWEDPYEDDTALSRGTAFPCLDKPFIGEEAVKNARTE